MHVIFSCENTRYMWWQAELLWYTYTKTGMQAQLTALVSPTGEPAQDFTCSSVAVSNYKNYLENECYTPLNKPGGIAEWAVLTGSEEETVFIIDPDSAFVGIVPDPGPLQKGEAYAERHDYMNIDLRMNQTVLDRHCRQNARVRVQPIGIYLMIKKSDLVELAPLWLSKSIDIYNDEVCRNTLPDHGWISEMWGYAIAAAELGIRHHITNFSQVTGSNCLVHPIIHYCFPVIEEPGQYWDPNQLQRVLWSKWDYKPWDLPPRSVPTVEGRALLENLAELAMARNHKSV